MWSIVSQILLNSAHPNVPVEANSFGLNVKTIFIREFEAPDEVTMLEIQKFLQYVTSKNEVISNL